jgi:antitoxin component YwqK of YwqJK toxin-antitoxin module
MNKDKDIKPFNDKGQKHGLWEVYYSKGKLMYKVLYHNGKEVGYEEYYLYTGKSSNKTYYI